MTTVRVPVRALTTALNPDGYLCLKCAEGGCDYPDCGCYCHEEVDQARAEALRWLNAITKDDKQEETR